MNKSITRNNLKTYLIILFIYSYSLTVCPGQTFMPLAIELSLRSDYIAFFLLLCGKVVTVFTPGI